MEKGYLIIQIEKSFIDKVFCSDR